MSDEVEVTGLKELADAMDALPERMQRAAVRPALNAAGQVFQAAIASTVPRDTGALAASIKRKVHVGRDGMSVIVGPEYSGGGTQDPGVRAKFLEFGTRKMSPRFFMRKAFAASKDAAYNAAVEVLRAILERLPK